MKKQSTDPVKELFADSEILSQKPQRCTYEGHVWTEKKAKLIQRYLWRFIQVTKCGAYIDAFSGSQRSESAESTWAAKLVLENKPEWMRRFYLFEKDPDKIAALNSLKKIHHKGWRKLSSRKVVVIQGDCNEKIPEHFIKNPLKQTLPTFCLLDQRTRECSWNLVQTVSKLKTKKCKVEIFYFLAQAWMDRHWHLTNQRNLDRLRTWWGSDDWRVFRKLSSIDRALLMEKRFRDELGYSYAQAFPIHKRGNSGRVMFWMIHASDDFRALPLMACSYKEIGLDLPCNNFEQIDMDSYW